MIGFIIGKIKKYHAIVFFVLDIILIFLAAWLSFLLRFDGKIPPDKIAGFEIFIPIALVVTIFVFIIRGMYKNSWKYVNMTDLPNIGGSVVISTLVLGLALFLLRDHHAFNGFPRSIIFIYGMLLFLLTGGLRFSKRIYWQLIRSRGVLLEEKISLDEQSKFEDRKPNKILITGGAGYIGSVLARQLLDNGYGVKVFDKLMFGEQPIEALKKNPNFQLVKGDILDTTELAKVLVDIDAVVHLAAIVGEPACLAKKDLALKTNYLGTVHLARLCKAYGIKRFIYASTCSAYGKMKEEDVLSEKSSEKPVDFYGETKIYAEKEVIKLISAEFAPTILRFSTVYGLSPRMRFDLVVNTFVKNAVKNKEICIFKGNQWRPLIHVGDLARAITLCVGSQLPKVGNQIFNVGDNRENYSISQIGEIVKECVPGTKITNLDNAQDRRSYKVSFGKIENILGFKAEKNVKYGVMEIKEAFGTGRFGDPENKIYYNHLAG